MSLEQALKENTEAMASLVKANKELNDVINSLIAVMRNAPPATRAEPKEHCGAGGAIGFAKSEPIVRATPIDPSLPPLVEAVKADHAAAKAEQEAKKSDSTSSAETPADTAAVSYDDLKKAFLDLSNAKGREACVALLSKFGAQKLSQVTEAQYAEMFADIQKAKA